MPQVTRQETRQENLAEDFVAVLDRFARFYDGDYRDYVEDLGLILDLAEECGDPVLELGCGTGRVMLTLAGAGYAVTGVDLSPALLDVARSKAATRKLAGKPTFVEDDLRTFDLPHKAFRLAVCTSNTLMHLTTVEDQLAALHNAYRHLDHDGLLLLDLFNPDVARMLAVNGVMEMADEWVDPQSGGQILKWSVRTVDFGEQVQDTLFLYEEILADGSVRRTPCPFRLRFLWRSEAELMLRSAGFEVGGVWGNFDGNPYEADSDHLILLARKP